jgi:hypothetical protein
MRLLFITLLIFFCGVAYSQERFLELTIAAQSENKALKNIEVLVSCEDGVDFILTSKKKELTFYLSAGLSYKIVVTKKGFYQSIYEVDLTTVPEALHQDGFLTHELTVELIPKTEAQPIDIHKYSYESRHGKLKIN